jgi:exosortase/archaeosortase family protein
MSNASLADNILTRRGAKLFERGVRYAKQHREAWPAVAIVVITIAAYNFTLASLFDFLRLDTPLAYLPLLPLFCVGIAWITAKRYANAKKPIKDRQIDYLVGIPMIVVALLLITLAPVIASTYYWSDRADVVSMALFAGGATIVAYGITWFWRLKASFIFLLLMWPALYLHLIAGLMQEFSNWTNSAMAQIVHMLPIGASLDSNPGDVIISAAHGAPITISIGTACSGADSVLGFALIGGSVLTVMTGGRGRKLLWWISGMVLTFILNIFRLTSIIFLAHIGHPGLALGGYHAVIGLILFAIAVMIMLWVLPYFGLHQRPPVVDAPRTLLSNTPVKTQLSAPVTVGQAKAVESLHPLARPREQQRGWSRRRIAALSAVAAFTVVVALADSGLQPYAAFDDGSGSPTVKPFSQLTSAPSKRWSIYEEAQYSWATEYFGADATWLRYEITPPGGGAAYADVVLTDDKGSLDAYNLENCFLFHNYDIVTSERIDLGSGVYGLLLNYHDPSVNENWASVSWAWPVTYKGTTYYERINLQSNPLGGVLNDATAPVAQPSFGIQDLFLDLLNGVSGGHNDPNAAKDYAKVDVSLESVAAALVTHTVANGS